jgi:hypothetical protein
LGGSGWLAIKVARFDLKLCDAIAGKLLAPTQNAP